WVELGSGFGRFLAAKIEFSHGTGQTVNLLALRLQWFESTPAHASSRAKITWIRGESNPCFVCPPRGNQFHHRELHILKYSDPDVPDEFKRKYRALLQSES